MHEPPPQPPICQTMILVTKMHLLCSQDESLSARPIKVFLAQTKSPKESMLSTTIPRQKFVDFCLLKVQNPQQTLRPSKVGYPENLNTYPNVLKYFHNLFKTSMVLAFFVCLFFRCVKLK